MRRPTLNSKQHARVAPCTASVTRTCIKNPLSCSYDVFLQVFVMMAS